MAAASVDALAAHAAKMALPAPAGGLTARDALPFIAAADALALSSKLLGDQKSAPGATEGSLHLLRDLALSVGEAALPHLLPLLPVILDRLQDKADSTRTAALAAAEAILAPVNGITVGSAYASLFDAIVSKRKWQTRAAGLTLIAGLATRLPAATTAQVVQLVPRLTDCMTDIRAEVAKAAEDAMKAVCACAGNRDIEAVIPRVISAIARPAEASEAIHALSSTTFVQAVLSPALAILVPLLERGLKVTGPSSTPIKRKTAIIISNMVKLVPETYMAAPLVPKLLPGLKKLRDEVADPECRVVATKAFEVMITATGCADEAAATAMAAAMAAALAAKEEAAKAAAAAKDAASKPAATSSKPLLKFKSGGQAKKDTKKDAKKEEAAPAAAAEKPARVVDPAIAMALNALEEALSLANLDLAAALATAATGAVEGGAGAGAEAAAGGAGAAGDEPEAASGAATGASAMVNTAVEFVATLAASLTSAKVWSEDEWKAAAAPFLLPLVALVPAVAADESAVAVHKAEALAIELLNRCYFAATGRVRVAGATEDGEGDDPDAEDATIPDLCKCEFSLAYGGKILLNSAKLHMKKGRAYGLIGANGCGKTTLMRAIANGQLEGFPTPAELKRFYVESSIPSHLEAATCVEYVLLDPLVRESFGLPAMASAAPTAADGGAGEAAPEAAAVGGAGAAPSASTSVPLKAHVEEVFVKPVTTAESEAEVVRRLGELGFSASMISGSVGGLSGGWRLKLALARAMMSGSALFLLDEPTNHLDIKNVAWLTDYLETVVRTSGISLMVVSHDSKFLDRICTHMVHFQNFKLKPYKGNLSAFVERFPEAASYHDLAATSVSWSFPEPGFLDGVKSRDKAILKVLHASMTYPGRDTPAVKNASVAMSLSSRVVVNGPNGAGKSTLIKMLTGELEATEGAVWKHPSLRIAYVAQHAAHHLETHLDMTPAEYIGWRFATGEDREAMAKVTRIITEEEKKKMASVLVIAGQKLQIKEILVRRKSGRSYEYETTFMPLANGQIPEVQWLPREFLESVGFGKAVDNIDSRAAAEAGLLSRPLTAANIARHLEGFGLDQEFTLHHRMRGLSGGQKVKVILGAAMWSCPQIIVLDEPSNFLDRDSLGALAAAVKDFQGGVLLITHAKDLVDALATETWSVVDGIVTTTGASWISSAVETKVEDDEMLDAYGNVVKKAAKLSSKQLKKMAKEKKARRKAGEDVSDDDFDE